MCILRNREPVSLLKVGRSWEGNMNGSTRIAEVPLKNKLFWDVTQR